MTVKKCFLCSGEKVALFFLKGLFSSNMTSSKQNNVYCFVLRVLFAILNSTEHLIMTVLLYFKIIRICLLVYIEMVTIRHIIPVSFQIIENNKLKPKKIAYLNLCFIRSFMWKLYNDLRIFSDHLCFQYSEFCHLSRIYR